MEAIADEEFLIEVKWAINGNSISPVKVRMRDTIRWLKILVSGSARVPPMYIELVNAKSNAVIHETNSSDIPHSDLKYDRATFVETDLDALIRDTGLTSGDAVLLLIKTPPKEALLSACSGTGDDAALVSYLLERMGDILMRGQCRKDEDDDEDDDEDADEERSALQLAAINGHARICKVLLEDEKYTAINDVTEEGETALHLCSHPDVCQLLLGSERFTKVNDLTNYGHCALRLSIPEFPATCDHEVESAQNSFDICKMLLEHPRFTAEHINSFPEGLSALHAAAYAGQAQICSLLLLAMEPSAIAAGDHNGRTALHKLSDIPGGLPDDAAADTCRVLLDDGRIDVNAVDNSSSDALQGLVQRGNTKAFGMILEDPRYTSINTKDSDNRSILVHLAQAPEDKGLEICSMILRETGFAELNSVDAFGKTALHHAALAGKPCLCRMLLDNDRFTEASAFDVSGCVPLHYALTARGARVSETCRTLLDHPRYTAINNIDGNLQTALHIAAHMNSSEHCELLLECERFTMVHAVDNTGRTAAEIAMAQGTQKVKDVFNKHSRSGT